MIKVIPDEELERFIKNTGWVPGQEVPVQSKVKHVVKPAFEYDIEDILKGKTFYNDKLPVALEQALDYAGSDGIVTSMPELISAKVKAGKGHDFWKQWYTVHTEENIGVDKKGLFYSKGEPVLVVVNGGGILVPDRIKQAYEEGLLNGSAKYDDEEFDMLLEGKLPDSSIGLYRFEEIKKGISNLPHRFGIVMPYKMAQKTKSGYYKKKAFLENPLVIARAGGLENLEAYYEKAKDSDGDLGNYHPFEGRDAFTPQGRVLFLYGNCGGLHGDDDLDYIGRFVGVAPEAPRAKK